MKNTVCSPCSSSWPGTGAGRGFPGQPRCLPPTGNCETQQQVDPQSSGHPPSPSSPYSHEHTGFCLWPGILQNTIGFPEAAGLGPYLITNTPDFCSFGSVDISSLFIKKLQFWSPKTQSRTQMLHNTIRCSHLQC